MRPSYVRQILDISTAHVSERTARILDEIVADDALLGLRPGVIVHGKGEHGWLVYVPSEPSQESTPDFPEDLRTCMEHARALDCDWVMFDRDGVVIDALPEYEW
jgi:hypothetical protein